MLLLVLLTYLSPAVAADSPHRHTPGAAPVHFEGSDTRHFLNITAQGQYQRRVEWTNRDKWLLTGTLVASAGALVLDDLRPHYIGRPAFDLEAWTPRCRTLQGCPERTWSPTDTLLASTTLTPLFMPMTLRRGAEGGGLKRALARHAVVVEAIGVAYVGASLSRSVTCQRHTPRFDEGLPTEGQGLLCLADAQNLGTTGVGSAVAAASTFSWLHTALIIRKEHGWSGYKGWLNMSAPALLNAGLLWYQVYGPDAERRPEQPGGLDPTSKETVRALVTGTLIGAVSGSVIPHLHRGGLNGRHRTWSESKPNDPAP